MPRSTLTSHATLDTGAGSTRAPSTASNAKSIHDLETAEAGRPSPIAVASTPGVMARYRSPSAVTVPSLFLQWNVTRFQTWWTPFYLDQLGHQTAIANITVTIAIKCDRYYDRYHDCSRDNNRDIWRWYPPRIASVAKTTITARS